MKKYICQLFKAQSGAMSARLEDNDGFTIHVHSLVRPEHESLYFDDLTIWGDRIILLGTGLGYHVQKIINEIPDKSKVLIVEYYKEMAVLCKEEVFSGIPDVIDSESSNPAAILKKFISGGEYVQVIRHPVSYRVQREFYDELLQEALSRKQWKTQGNILLMYGNYFIQEELRNALTQSKFNIEVFDYRKIDTYVGYQNELQRVLQKHKPEMIFSVNMLGFDGNGIWSDLSFKYGVPVCVWFVDDPSPIILHQQQFVKSNTIAFCWERAYLNKLTNDGFSKAYFLPLATDPEIFSLQSSSENATRVGFVGSAMSDNFINQIKEKFLWSSSLEPVVNESAAALLKNSNSDPLETVFEIYKKLNKKLPFSDRRNLVWMRALIIHTASMMKRKMIIDNLIGSGIETFGDPSGWKSLYGSRIKTNPDIDYRTELASTYRKIIININITSCQMSSAVNQRVFDIPACGGFVINDMQSDLAELFESNEVVTYLTAEELMEKIAYYEQNETLRKDICKRAYNRIINEHTYKNRCEEIYQRVKS